MTTEITATAYHEAGHAIAAVLKGFKFKQVTIVPNEEEESLGHVLYGMYDMFMNIGRRAYARDLREFLVCNRAGPLAEERHNGKRNDEGAGGDDDRFWSILWEMYGERQDRHARDLTRQARLFVNAHWGAIEHVAKALLQQQTLSFETVERLVQEAPPSIQQRWKTLAEISKSFPDRKRRRRRGAR